MAFPVCDSLPLVVAEVVGLSLPNVSLDIWHTNLDSNPNPNRSTNAHSLFHGCGTPKLVSVAPDRSLQLGTSSSGGEEKLENS